MQHSLKMFSILQNMLHLLHIPITKMRLQELISEQMYHGSIRTITEEMGTSGADCYLAETIFTLTENDLIKFVRIEMNYGSHASPGLYNRDNFKDIKIK